MYPYIFVDEAQDTSLIQFAILRILANKTENIFMVGDEDQSIYGFRAAYPEGLYRFLEWYPKGNTLFMETNYRSAKDIVHTADSFIGKNTFRHQKKLLAARDEKGAVHEEKLASRGKQYYRLLELLKNCDGTESIGALYRNNDSALPLVDLLEERGVAYYIASKDSSFFTHLILEDIRKIFALAENPKDGELFMELYYKFDLRIRKADAMSAVAASKNSGKTIFSCLISISKGKQRKKLEAFQDSFFMILYDTASDAMRRILYSLGYMEFLKSRNMDVEKAYLLQLLSHGKPSMKKFFLRLEELHQIISEGRHRHAESTVTLSTIHGSKGLEYDQVFILDALEHILPSVREEGFLTEVQYMEERRLYYVAMTRARNQLTIFSYGHETSPFTMEVFGHPMDSAKKKAMKFHFAKEGITNKNAIEKAKPKMDLSSYTVGTAIHHKKFGEGSIIAISGTQVQVQFSQNGTKTLSLPVLLQQRLLL